MLLGNIGGAQPGLVSTMSLSSTAGMMCCHGGVNSLRLIINTFQVLDLTVVLII